MSETADQLCRRVVDELFAERTPVTRAELDAVRADVQLLAMAVEQLYAVKVRKAQRLGAPFDIIAGLAARLHRIAVPDSPSDPSLEQVTDNKQDAGTVGEPAP